MCEDSKQETGELLQPVALGNYCDRYIQSVNIDSILTIGRVWTRNMYPPRLLEPVVTYLRWEDVPQAERVCQCNEFNAGCEASPHFARVEYGMSAASGK